MTTTNDRTADFADWCLKNNVSNTHYNAIRKERYNDVPTTTLVDICAAMSHGDLPNEGSDSSMVKLGIVKYLKQIYSA